MLLHKGIDQGYCMSFLLLMCLNPDNILAFLSVTVI